MVDELQAEANHIENSKETLSFGGLNYYLSILSKNNRFYICSMVFFKSKNNQFI